MKFTEEELAIHKLAIRNSQDFLKTFTNRWNKRNSRRTKKIRMVGEGPYGETPLTREVRAGRVKYARMILEQFPEQVNVPDRVGWAPMAECIINTNLEMARLLLQYGGDLSWQGPDELSLLALLQEELYACLLESKADEEKKRLEALNYVRVKKLDWTVRKQKRCWDTLEEKRKELLEVFKLLHDHGASFDMEDKKKRTPASMLRGELKCEEHRLMLEYYEKGSAERNAVMDRIKKEEEAEKEKLMEEMVQEELLKLEKKLERKTRVVVKRLNGTKKTRKGRKGRRGGKKKPLRKNQKRRLMVEEELVGEEQMEVERLVESSQLIASTSTANEKCGITEETVIEDGEVAMDCGVSEYFEDASGEGQMKIVPEEAAREEVGETPADEDVSDNDSATDSEESEEKNGKEQTVSPEIVGEETEDDEGSLGMDLFSGSCTELPAEGADELQVKQKIVATAVSCDFLTKIEVFKEKPEQQDVPMKLPVAVELNGNEKEPVEEANEESVGVAVEHNDVVKAEELVDRAEREEIPEESSVEPREPVGQQAEATFSNCKAEVEKLSQGFHEAVVEPREPVDKDAEDKFSSCMEAIETWSQGFHEAVVESVKPVKFYEDVKSAPEVDSVIEPRQEPVLFTVTPCTLDSKRINYFEMESPAGTTSHPAHEDQNYIKVISNPQAKSRTPEQSVNGLKRKIDAKVHAEPKVRKTSNQPIYFDNPREKMIRKPQNVPTAPTVPRVQNPPMENRTIQRQTNCGVVQLALPDLSIAEKAERYSAVFRPQRPREAAVNPVPMEPNIVASSSVAPLEPLKPQLSALPIRPIPEQEHRISPLTFTSDRPLLNIGEGERRAAQSPVWIPAEDTTTWEQIVPTTPAPTWPAPALPVSTLSAPTWSPPTWSSPSMSVPSLPAPAWSAPTMSAPTMPSPSWSAPTTSVPTIPAPAWSSPPMHVPTMPSPSWSAPTFPSSTLPVQTVTLNPSLVNYILNNSAVLQQSNNLNFLLQHLRQ